MMAKRLARLSLLTAVALVLHIAESFFPPVVPLAGVKLGLANIVTLLAMVCMSKRDALIILLLRISWGSLFGGSFVSFLYSLTGGLFCFGAMAAALVFLSSKQLWAVSMLGALAHNAGQLLAASVILENVRVFWYAPALVVSALVTGLFIGLCAGLLRSHLPFLHA